MGWLDCECHLSSLFSGGSLCGYGVVVFATHSCEARFTRGARRVGSRTSPMHIARPIYGSYLSIRTISVCAWVDAGAFCTSVRQSGLLSEHNLTHAADSLPIGPLYGFSEGRYRNLHSHYRSNTARSLLCHSRPACSSVSDLRNSHNARSYNSTAFDTLQIQFSEAAYKDVRVQHPHPVPSAVLNPLPIASTAHSHTHTTTHEFTCPEHAVLHPVPTPSRRDCRRPTV